MKKVTQAKDSTGRTITKGDSVTDLTGQMTGRVSDLAVEDGEQFVQIRPLHQPYAPGVWYAADRLIWQAAGRKRRSSGKKSA